MADCKEVKLDFTLKELTLSSQSEDVPGSSSTVALRSNKFVCVEYPAVVTNVDKMLETLGGEENLSKVGTNDRDTLCAEFLSLNKGCLIMLHVIIYLHTLIWSLAYLVHILYDCENLNWVCIDYVLGSISSRNLYTVSTWMNPELFCNNFAKQITVHIIVFGVTYITTGLLCNFFSCNQTDLCQPKQTPWAPLPTSRPFLSLSLWKPLLLKQSHPESAASGS